MKAARSIMAKLDEQRAEIALPIAVQAALALTTQESPERD
jgi:hypothetical protein